MRVYLAYQLNQTTIPSQCGECSGTKIRLVVELVGAVQMIRRQAGGLVRFAALDRLENLSVLRQGQQLETGLANKVEVELGKPFE